MNKNFICLILFLSCWLTLSLLFAQDHPLFQKEVYYNNKGDSLPYRVLFPVNNDEQRDYPLVVFLHGAGERGNDNEKQLTHGAELFLDPGNRADFPAIVVFPQCPEDKYWVDINIRKKLYAKEKLDFNEVKKRPTKEMKLVLGLLKEVAKKENVNKKQVYIMGLSMGGLATFEMITRWPRKFAAAIAICGGGNPEMAKKYANKVPLWMTHGTKDQVIPVEYSRDVYYALIALGAEVKFTEFPEAGHNAWDPTFELPDLLPWLFSREK